MEQIRRSMVVLTVEVVTASACYIYLVARMFSDGTNLAVFAGAAICCGIVLGYGSRELMERWRWLRQQQPVEKVSDRDIH